MRPLTIPSSSPSQWCFRLQARGDERRDPSGPHARRGGETDRLMTARRSARSSRATRAICRSASPARCSPGSWTSERRSSKATRWRRSTRRTIRTACAQRKRTSPRPRRRSSRRRRTEARQAKLLKDGWTPKATYDTALQQSAVRRGQAHVCQGQSRPHPRSAQLHRAQGRFRRRDHRRRCRSRARMSTAGQMVVKLARPDDKDGVFNIAETAFTRYQQDAARGHRLAAVQSGPDDRGRGARDFSGRRSGDAHLHGQSHAEEPAAAAPLRHEHRRPFEREALLSSSRCRSPPCLKRTARRLSGCSIQQSSSRRAEADHGRALRDRYRRHRQRSGQRGHRRHRRRQHPDGRPEGPACRSTSASGSDSK